MFWLLFPTLGERLTARLKTELDRGRGRKTDFVLCTRAGRPLSQRNVGLALSQAADKAGLGKVTPHDLRRPFCSLGCQAAALTRCKRRG